MTLIKDLIDIPEQIQKGDFVLKLTEGLTRPELTVQDYVVTPELKDCFNNALSFIQSAIQTNSSKASYLHGSFGSGKSHFMAVLNLILEGIPAARSIKELAPVITRHNPWIAGKKFLLVPYHLIDTPGMESGILGGYVDYIRRHHPDAPIPGVYLAEGLFQDAQALRQRMGDAEFFQALSEGANSNSGWGDLTPTWNAERFTAAVNAGPGTESRSQLISALIKHFFSSYNQQKSKQAEAFVSLDLGLSVISKHAKSLGYDALILFLDELILWLASHANDLKFIHQEGQKLAKLVEAQLADRPIPVISFVARQRDLSDLVGASIPGAERLNFSDALKHWEGRFHRITLEDRNLPAIAEKRILKCRTATARQELDAAFSQTAKVRDSVMNVLLTSDGDREMFRKLYPFSPALVQTLIAVSSVLQRERTALKVMMQLLVDQQDTLKVGDVVPVGDLFDVVAHGDEAFSPEMAIHFDNAKRLYQQKLLPELEKKHGRREELDQLDPENPKRIAFRNDDRLVKTLLLSALVPEVESLRGLNAERLAALNHGTIKSPIPGREGQEVLRRCRDWAASIGEIRIGEDTSSPSISVQLSGVDTDSILKQADREDNRGNRIRLIREMLYEQLNVKGDDQIEQYREFIWKNTKRTCTILFRNIRELTDASLNNLDDDWKLIIDYPFDEATHSPVEDRQRCQEFQAAHENGTKTLCWIPSFLSESAQKELGTLVLLEHVLTGERFLQYANHLSLQDRQTAKTLLENQRSVLRQRVRNHLDAAYGISTAPESLATSTSLELHEQFVSLWPSLELQPPTAASLADALEHLLAQALAHEFPGAPDFEADVNNANNLKKVFETIKLAAQTPDGRVEVEKPQRPLLRQIANPLKLGEMAPDATHFILGQHWKTHFNRQTGSSSTLQVSQLRQWIDQPKPMGLSKELQNLVILAYAEQTSRSFFRHNLPIDVSLKEIANDCELREQKLPDEADWLNALERAKEIFAIVITPLRKASTVNELSSKVQDKAKSALPDCRRYQHFLQTSLESLHQDLTCARMTTATTTLAMLERLSTAKLEDIIQALTEVDVATTAAAMHECLHQAANLAGILEGVSWDIFQGIADLTDERQAKAQDILSALTQALCNDEHVTPLGAQIRQSQPQAVRLLSQQRPPTKPSFVAPLPSSTAPPTVPIPPIPTPVGQPPAISEPIQSSQIQGSQTELSLKAAETLLLELSKSLKPSQTICLNISWMILDSDPNATKENSDS